MLADSDYAAITTVRKCRLKNTADLEETERCNVNVGQRYGTIKNERRFAEVRAHRDTAADKIIDRGRVYITRSMKDGEKICVSFSFLLFYAPFSPRFVFASEGTLVPSAVSLLSRKQRRTRRIDRAFYWRADLVFWKRHNFPRPTSRSPSRLHTRTLLHIYARDRRAI